MSAFIFLFPLFVIMWLLYITIFVTIWLIEKKLKKKKHIWGNLFSKGIDQITYLSAPRKDEIPYNPTHKITEMHQTGKLDDFLNKFGKQIGVHLHDRSSFDIPLSLTNDFTQELISWLEKQSSVSAVVVEGDNIHVTMLDGF